MNNRILIALILILITIKSKSQNKDCAECGCFSNSSPIWKVEFDKKGTEYLVRGDSIKYYSKNVKLLIEELNKRKQVKAKFIKISKSVVYVKILNTTTLTQKLGTDGANSYLAILVFTLTEYSGHKKVYIDFKEGDHGGKPGLRDRSYFKDKFIACPDK